MSRNCSGRNKGYVNLRTGGERRKGCRGSQFRLHLISPNRKRLECGEDKMGSILYLSKGKLSSFLFPSPPNIQTSPGEMAWMKFKWNQATFSLISTEIITLEGNLGRDPSMHWDSSAVLLASACSWARFNLYFLPCPLWMELVPGDDLTTGVSRDRNSHLFSNLSSEAIKNQDWRI